MLLKLILVTTKVIVKVKQSYRMVGLIEAIKPPINLSGMVQNLASGKCYKCGGDYPHDKSKPCRDEGAKCNNCKSIGHFSKVCKQPIVGSVVDVRESSLNSDSVVRRRGNLFSVEQIAEVKRPKMKIKVNEQAMEMLVDSGADITVIDECSFKLMRPKPILEMSSSSPCAFDSSVPLPVRGQFTACLKANERQFLERVTVIKGRPGCLLSQTASRRLALFQLPLFSPLDETRLSVVSSKYASLMSRFPSVFNNQVGKLKGYEVHLSGDPNVRPVKLSYTRAPYNMLEQIEKELDKLIDQGILVEVKEPAD